MRTCVLLHLRQLGPGMVRSPPCAHANVGVYPRAELRPKSCS